MAFNANFTRVTMRDDGALTVAGTSEPATGSDGILVALVHAGEMRSKEVADPQLSPWEAVFPASVKPFTSGDDVFVVGVARRMGADPFVWQGGFEIKGRANA